MTSQGDGSAGQHPNNTSLPPLDVRKTRSPTADESPETPGSILSFRPASPSILASRSSTLSGFLSRSSSPNGRSSLSLARFGRSTTASPLANVADSNDETRTLIVRAFSPVVGVLASPETDELVRGKGLKHGFAGFIQPYGERITGKVVVRDSVGASRAWEDFGVRFLDLRQIMQEQSTNGAETLDKLEDLVEQYLDQHTGEYVSHGQNEMSPYYRLFLSRLLSSQSVSQHETFSHPVATVIAISSSTAAPIETLRNLYAQTAHGGFASPPYANPEYLRYYVLVHDDDKDDFAKSSALFDQMKRHFGLHCHLLRLRSVPCSRGDEDIEEMPLQEWLSASADLSKLQETTQLIDLDTDTQPPIFATDAANIRTFIRELVSQSIVPNMEQRISLWNEQIASRRRGISGRFMSISKRWGGLGSLTGSSSRNSSATNLSTTSSTSGNYDSIQGYYRWDTPEALLRKMADFTTMLRDYKLASSTYDLLRSDYNNDKAWKYLAGVNEMCCITNLLNPLLSAAPTSSSSSKTLPKLETFDSMLEAASYSYLTRCNEPALALRSLLLTIELLKVRGRLPGELASKWAVRVLDLNLAPQSSNLHVLISERIASCYAGNRPSTATNHTSAVVGSGAVLSQRTRHAALWSLTAAEEWMKLGRAPFAAANLQQSQDLYAELRHNEAAMSGFKEMSAFMHDLSLTVRMKLGQTRKRGVSGVSATGHLVEPGYADGDPLGVGADDVEEQMETLDSKPSGGHRRGLSINTAVDVQGPLSPIRRRSVIDDPLAESNGVVDDDFE
ncbi:hypothetical protein H2198_004412 [Neophaeococcomyces mojaviensis]|uniref:Uncharacterized protein n=1 Tax=Neophaeococcomyces mojaviensis TaxID=3383035 RepID=A0ACC3A8L6_9EURO|nr:hypothetical protein H2198_004412 [Knufia sp. JES_112]